MCKDTCKCIVYNRNMHRRDTYTHTYTIYIKITHNHTH